MCTCFCSFTIRCLSLTVRSAGTFTMSAVYVMLVGQLTERRRSPEQLTSTSSSSAASQSDGRGKLLRYYNVAYL